jgi:hypothetical protein
MIVGPYSQIFEELNASFCDLLSHDGHKESVYFNGHQVPSEIPRGSIVYNMENVGVQIAPTLFQGCTVWDMSARNVALWQAAGRDAVHVPLGYHREFERFKAKPWGERDIDVVLFGCLNERRIHVLRELEQLGAKIVHLFDRYGKDRNDVLARAKISLNMLYYPNGFFPALRLLKCAPNGVINVSEIAPEAPSWAYPRPVPYEKLVQTCAQILALAPEQAEALANEARERLVSHPLRLPT